MELTFKTGHADLYRQPNGDLMVHLVDVDEGELMAAIAAYHAAVLAAEEEAKAQEASTPQPGA